VIVVEGMVVVEGWVVVKGVDVWMCGCGCVVFVAVVVVVVVVCLCEFGPEFARWCSVACLI
jgi:hypothetical protein